MSVGRPGVAIMRRRSKKNRATKHWCFCLGVFGLFVFEREKSLVVGQDSFAKPAGARNLFASRCVWTVCVSLRYC